MQFKIEKVEKKTTSTGKPMARVDLIGAEGELLENVTVWGDHPDFEALAVGSTVEGEYKDDGKWKTLYGIKPKAPVSGGNMRGVAAAQERKGAMIASAQENKSQAIKVAAAMRDAVAIAIASLSGVPFPTDAEFQAEIVKWRTWYLKEWDIAEKTVDVPF